MSFQAYLSSRPATHVASPETLWRSREWADYVREVVRYYRYNVSVARLNHHDWDDIAQIAMIHVWNKRAHYDPAKPLKPWLKTVVLMQVKNGIRNRVVFGRSNCAQFRRSLSHPMPLVTKTVNVTRGIEEVVYEPDAIDPRSTWPEEMTIERMSKVKPRDALLLERLLSCNDLTTWALKESGAKSLRSKRARRVYVRLHKGRQRLQQSYRAALNQ